MLTLRPYQEHALRFIDQQLQRTPGCGVFMDPGTGKTIVAIRAFGPLNRVLIVCRRDDYLTWRLELIGDGYDPPGEMHTSADPIPDTGWVIVSYDIAKQRVPDLKEAGFDGLIFDEGHYLRGPTTARTKAMHRLAMAIPNRLLLTATPYGNDLDDMWGEAFVIDEGHALGRTFWAYRNRWKIKSGPGWYDRRGAREEIINRLKRLAFSIPADEVLSLPRRRYQLRGFPMSASQRKHYRSVMDDWEYTLNTTPHAVELDLVLQQHTTARQIAAGFIYDYVVTPEGKRKTGPPRWLKCPKWDGFTKWLGQRVMTTDGKTVVWAAHRAECARIAQHIRHAHPDVGVATLDGTGRRRERERVRFRDDPTCRVFMANPDRGAGMNELVVADTAAYYSNSRKAISRIQSETRTRRSGSEQHDRIDYVDFVTEDTIDIDIRESVRANMDYSEYLAQRLKLRSR